MITKDGELIDQKHAWSEPGPRGMRTKNRETFVPNSYVRRWQEGNEEKMIRAMKRFKSLKMKVIFFIEEDKEDIARRTNTNKLGGPTKTKWTGIRGKTIFIKNIPNQGMFFQLIKAMQDAAVEVVQK